MSSASIDLGEDLAVLLHASNQPVQQTAREFIVLELYRRGSISSGKAAQLLGISRWPFIHHASALGIPYFEMTEDEWTDERVLSDKPPQLQAELEAWSVASTQALELVERLAQEETTDEQR